MSKYEEYVRKFNEDYHPPTVDGHIVGLSGITPNRKTKASEVNHDDLYGVKGGDVFGAYHVSRNELVQFKEYQRQIDTLKKDTESSVKTLKTNIDTVSKEASSAVSSLKTKTEQDIASARKEASSAVTSLKTKTEQDITSARKEAASSVSTLRNETSSDISAIRTQTETEIAEIKTKTAEQISQMSSQLRSTESEISGRMSEIEGSQSKVVTEQGRLNTRLDVILEGATEDSEILDARVDAEDEVHPNLGHNIRNLHRLLLEFQEAFQGLLRQFGSLVEAQIQYELDEQEAHNRRKREIQQEALTREEHDDSLQSQVDQASQAGIINALNLSDEADKRRRVREALEAERSERISHNALHNEEISRNALDIDLEAQARADGDLGLAKQADVNAEANIRNTVYIQESNARRKADISREEQARHEEDAGILVQVNQLAIANMWIAVREHEAHQKMKELETDIEAGIISIPGRAATDEEFDEMLDGLYNNP